MKRFALGLIFVLVISLIVPVSYSQNKIDFWLRDLIHIQQQKPSALSKKLNNALQFGRASMVNVIIQSSNRDFSYVSENGGQLRTIAGPYATALLPLASVEDIAALTQVKYISAAVINKPLNDLATKLIGLDGAIQAGYTGEEVLFGLVDTGIDITHPGFKDASGGSRILYLWDQTQTGSSPMDPFYDYGIEWTKAQIDANECTSKDFDGHGTHVAGSIAQYIVSDSDSVYNGGAIASNLIIVKTDNLSTSILDGINYTFEKARQLGKPAVVSISLGNQQGPHDGTDPVTAARDYLTGAGRIIVQAAGNDGDTFIHHQVEANTDGADMEFTIESIANILQFELWYDGKEDVTIQVLAPGEVLFLTAPSGTKTKGEVSTPFGTVYLSNAFYGPEFYNGDKCIIIDLKDSVAVGNWKFRLVCSNPTTVHAWMYNGDPSAGFRFSTDDNHYTLVNQACGKSVIAIGAMVTRNQLQIRDVEGYPDGTVLDVDEEIGQVASYSSGGPTRDGRLKPEAIAPGTYIASSMSADIQTNSDAASSDFRSIGPRYPVFGAIRQLFMQGTSMATPIFSAIFGTLFKKKQKLNPDAAKEFIKKASKHTKSVPTAFGKKAVTESPWHYREGYGLIDLRDFLEQKLPLVTCKQISENTLEADFSFIVEGADNPANYAMKGASASLSVTNAVVNNDIVTLTMSDELSEGYRDSLYITTGVQGFSEPATIEVDKIGTIVDVPSLLTNEIWRVEESPYYVHGQVELDSVVRLAIEPGTLIKFMPNANDSSEFVVFGELIAHGTKETPIVFTSLKESRNGEWQGIYFDENIPITTLKFCEIRYANNGIDCRSSELIIENCKIYHSFDMGFYALDCSPKIQRTIIWGSKGGDFSDGIYLKNALASTVIENVTIHGNDRAGIACFSSNPQIRNSIISNNTIGIHSQDGIPPKITYSDVWQNAADYSGTSAAGTGCISKNPVFANPDIGDFRLSENSPCIDAGDPDPEFNDPDGTRNDLGAIYRHQFVAPMLIAPENGEKRVSINPTLKWKLISGATSYKVQVSISVDFSTISIDTSGITTDSLCLNTLLYSTTYYWRVKAVNELSNSDWSESFSFITEEPSDVKLLSRVLPEKYHLEQNYPNPFNSATEIRFQIPLEDHVILKIFNSLGEEIRTLADEKFHNGIHSMSWDGKDADDNPLPSGIYLYRLHAGSYSQTKKMILLR